MDNFSLLTNWLSRPFPIALGQLMANAKLGDAARMALLNRLYNTLAPADKLRCKGELHWCKQARRGNVEARIT